MLAAGAALIASAAALCAVGRVALSWLPVGRPGGHQGRELAPTCAASFVLGSTLFLAAWLLVPVGLPMRFSLAGLVVLAAVALGARLATRPAALVPRHEPAPLSDPLGARLLRWTAIAVLTAGALRVGTHADARSSTSLHVAVPAAFAALALCEHALERARVPTWIRAASGLVVAIGFVWLGFPAHDAAPSLVALGVTAGAAGTVSWIRRGDARGLALACVGYTLCGLSSTEQWAIPFAGALVLVHGSARGQRRRAVLWALLPLAAAANPLLVAMLTGFAEHRAGLELAAALPWPRAVPVILLAACATAVLAGSVARARRPAPEWNSSGAPRGQEERVLLRTLVLTLLLAWGWNRIGGGGTGLPLLSGLGWLAILAGMGMAHVFPARRPA